MAKAKVSEEATSEAVVERKPRSPAVPKDVYVLYTVGEDGVDILDVTRKAEEVVGALSSDATVKVKKFNKVL